MKDKYIINLGNNKYAGIPKDLTKAICNAYTLNEAKKVRTFVTKESAQNIVELYLDCACLSPCNACEDAKVVSYKE